MAVSRSLGVPVGGCSSVGGYNCEVRIQCIVAELCVNSSGGAGGSVVGTSRESGTSICRTWACGCVRVRCFVAGLGVRMLG